MRKNVNVNIIAVIPARGDSKGIPKKNIKELGGKPLVYYSIILAQGAKKKGLIRDYLFSTDNLEIKSVAKKYKADAPFLRPKRLATDRSLMVDTVIHAVKWWEKNNKEKIHSVLLLQPTHPMTSLEDIKKSIKHYLNHQPEAKCLISICHIENIRITNLYYKKCEYLEQLVKGINPTGIRQNLRPLCWRNGGIYITRRDLLFGKKMLITGRPLFYEMPRARSVDLDDMFDWTVAELLIRYYRMKKLR